MLRDIFNQEMNIKKGMITLLLLALAATTSVTGFLLANDNKDIVISKDEDSQQMGQAENSKKTIADKANEKQEEKPLDEIKVYVVGEVNKPGVVTLKKGQIIQDAIELAGGPTQDADIENINLAFEMEENVMLRVRSRSERIQQGADESSSVPAKSASGMTDKNNSGSDASENKAGQENNNVTITGITLTNDSGGAIVGENDNSKAPNAKININTATVEELDTLPGIGPSTAAKIVSHREQNGDFKAIEEIMNVSGIGESKFNNIKESITVK